MYLFWYAKVKYLGSSSSRLQEEEMFLQDAYENILMQTDTSERTKHQMNVRASNVEHHIEEIEKNMLIVSEVIIFFSSQN